MEKAVNTPTITIDRFPKFPVDFDVTPTWQFLSRCSDMARQLHHVLGAVSLKIEFQRMDIITAEFRRNGKPITKFATLHSGLLHLMAEGGTILYGQANVCSWAEAWEKLFRSNLENIITAAQDEITTVAKRFGDLSDEIQRITNE